MPITWFKSRRSRPSAEDAARRLVILKYVVVYGIICRFSRTVDKEKREEFWQSPRQAGLWSHLSRRERQLARSTSATMRAQQQVDASWRTEAVQTLMWALGLVPQLPAYDTMANPDLLKSVPFGEVSDFISSAQLRDQAEINRERDIAELWHWRSRTKQLIEEGAGQSLP